MYLYIIFFLILFTVLVEISQNRKKIKNQTNSVIYISFILLLLLLSSIRWENGTDWDSYLRIWEIYDSPTFIGEMEIGFIFLTSLNHWFINHYTFHLCIMAIICIIPVSIINYKYSPYPLFSLFIWYVCNFAHIFNVRQTIAISIIFCTIPFILKRRRNKYILLIILATLFHKTAIIALPIYWLWNIKLKKNQYVIIILVCSLVSIYLSNLFSIILRTLGGGIFETQLNYYLNEGSNTFGQEFSPIQILVRGIINRSFILIIGLYLLDKIRKKSVFINGIVNMYFTGTIMFILFTPLSVALNRLGSYYDFFQILLIPSIFIYKMKKELRLSFFFILSLYLLYRFRGIVMNYEDAYIPYKFFFQF